MKHKGDKHRTLLVVPGLARSVRDVRIIHPQGEVKPTPESAHLFATFSMRSRGARFEVNVTACVRFLATCLARSIADSSSAEEYELVTCVDTDSHVVEFYVVDKTIDNKTFDRLETTLRAYSRIYGWGFFSDRQVTSRTISTSRRPLQS
jgi:hypothetical protein